MRRFFYALAIGTLAMAMSTPVFAQSATGSNSGMTNNTMASSGSATVESGGASMSDLNVSRYKAWDEFRTSNPKVVSELRHNPRLAGNEHFVNEHPTLKQLFESNSGLQQDIEHNPGNYMARAYNHRGMTHHHHHAEEHKAKS
jgi:hypothetical protein